MLRGGRQQYLISQKPSSLGHHPHLSLKPLNRTITILNHNMSTSNTPSDSKNSHKVRHEVSVPVKASKNACGLPIELWLMIIMHLPMQVVLSMRGVRTASNCLGSDP